jgi:hypothetical protein
VLYIYIGMYIYEAVFDTKNIKKIELRQY